MSAKFRLRVSGRGWAYIGAVLGGGVSVAANVAHSYVPPAHMPDTWTPQTGAVIGAVFWPSALLVVIEILARNEWPAEIRWKVVRFLGLVPVAIVAAVVSYRHMSGLLTFYREDALTATIGPIAVDGLMVMATGALVATSRLIPDTRHDTGSRSVTAATSPAPVTERVPVLDTTTRPDPTPDPTPKPRRNPTRATTPRATDTAAAVAKLRSKEPDITQAAVAKRLGVTDRTVQRYWSTTPAPDTQPDNVTPIHKEVQA